MILSASRRTDIPGFYTDWFMNRLRDGYTLIRNPYNPRQVRRVVLHPDIVDCIVFWTKDPAPLLSRLAEIEDRGYSYCFQFTLTPYGPCLERNLRSKEEILKTFLALGERIGKNRIQWRYDPVLLTEEWTVQRHTEAFTHLCHALAPVSAGVTISFIDMYRRCRAVGLHSLTSEEMREIGRNFGAIAKEYALPIQTCCEKIDLSIYGIRRGGCISRELLEEACGDSLLLKPAKHQRHGCGCVESVDIGAYNTCLHDCIYCYASDSQAAVQRQLANYDPLSPLLIGRLKKEDTVYTKAEASERQGQMRLPG